MSILNNYFHVFFSIVIFVIAQPAYAKLDRASEMGFIAHKAHYEIKMASKKSSASVSNITGTMIYEWQPSCDDAWITTHNFDMLYEYREIPPVRINSHFSTRETFDGQKFNFALQRKQNGAVYEEVRGNAYKNSDDQKGKAEYTKPVDLVFTLPEGTLFPTSHTMAVVQQIRDGRKFDNLTLFDGSDEQGPVDVNTIILSKGAVKEISPGSENIDQALLKPQNWNLRLAFFPLIDPTNDQADYEISVNFHENGVISDMKIDYKDFSVIQNLTTLEPIEISCDM
ncbi:MAG: DUF1849 family protein [Alphaproteobacteria bacterium]|nr:DUF1849 family protein [Alphaproteobacteria bacterium]